MRLQFFSRWPFILLILFATIVASSPWAGGEERLTSPISSQRAVQSFRLADPNLTIELVAAEPDISSPVAVAWDETGRMYVVEMSDYPVGPPSGKVNRLEDRDGDGKYERVTVFADDLAFPTGVLPWKGGVLVTAAPNIWYFKDNDGDGRADERRVVFTGFGEGNHQLRVNGLLWGLDNWVYGANGRSDGEIRRAGGVNAPVSIRRRDFRFKPESGEFEAIAGPSQFGLARDDWGNRFLSWNTIPIRHVVLEERYLNRNPYLASAASAISIADPADQGRLFSISPRPRTFNREPVEFFNAGCGLTIYRGHLLGEAYQGNAFVCEPLTNLVHRRVLTPAGPTFIAKRGEQGKEFLASTDPWFHPVNLATGPDGCLYVVDFYREWVEHPQFVPEHLRQKIDWRKGSAHGRIWRIRSKDTAAPAKVRDLSRADAAALVGCLSHPNGWQRDTSQRLLVERQDQKVIPLLQGAVKQAATPQAKVHALWSLDGLQAVYQETLLHALYDKHPRVREQAIRLSESCKGGAEALRKAAADRGRDPDVRVRFQCVLALGGSRDPHSLGILADVAHRDSTDEWTRLAIVSGLQESASLFLRALFERHRTWLNTRSANEARLLTEVASIIGARKDEAELAECLALILQTAPATRYSQLALLAGLTEGLNRAGWPLHVLLEKPPAALVKPLQDHELLLDFARQTAVSDKEELSFRVLAVQVLVQAKAKDAGRLSITLLQPQHPPAVQSAAARGLAEMGEPALISQALEGWNGYTREARNQLISSVLRSPKLAVTLIEAIEEEKIGPAEVDAAAREALRRVPNADLQQRIKKLFPKDSSPDRQAVTQKYQASLRMTGNRSRGAQVFGKHCLTCHQIQGQGHRVGPDLAGIGSRPKEALLADILDPSKERAPDFINYLAVTNSGQVLTGLIAAETATSVKLRRAEGAEDTVLRTEIQELRASGKSLMPDGLEQSLSMQDVADLLEFLQASTPLPSAGKPSR